MYLKDLARVWCPPVLWGWLRKIKGKDTFSFEGDYESWAAAQERSSGYDADEVLQRVLESSLKVKNGDAIFERDSVCFQYEEFRWPTLSCLLAIATERGGELRVLDFGGSMGSFYFQHKKFLSKLKHISWSVVEQKQFVECGREQLQDDILKFYASVGDLMVKGSVDVVLLSSVLQYLENPYQILTSLAEIKAPYLLIDRTCFVDEPKDRLSVQRVPEFIYKASYPAWFFSQQKFKDEIANRGYRLLTEFSCDEDAGIGTFKGALFERVPS